MRDKDFIVIEEYFNEKRGTPTLLSPLDWQLIEQWHKLGIPLKIVLMGIDSAFEKFKKSKKKEKKINSLSYCNQEVMAAWEEHKELTIGKSSKTKQNKMSTELWKQQTEKKLIEVEKKLHNASLKAKNEGRKKLSKLLHQVSEKIQNLTQLLKQEDFDLIYFRKQLDSLDKEVGTALISSAKTEEIEKAKSIAEEELKKYKKRMNHDIYQQIIDNFIQQYLQQKFDIPRISLLI